MLLRHGREGNVSCHGGEEKLLCGGFTGAENSRLALEKKVVEATAVIGLFNFPKNKS